MQTHLNHLGLENFRVFKERTDFHFAPITILTGTNSSGKSSLISAMEMLKNSIGLLDVKPPEGLLANFYKPEKPVKHGLGIHFIDKPLDISYNAEKYGDVSTLLTNGGDLRFSFFRKIKGYKTNASFIVEYRYELDDRELPKLKLVQILMKAENGETVLSIAEFVKVKVSYFFELFCQTFDASQHAWREFFKSEDELVAQKDRTDKEKAAVLRLIAKELGLYFDVYDDMTLGDTGKELFDERLSSLFDDTEFYKKYLSKLKISDFHDIKSISELMAQYPEVKTYIDELVGLDGLGNYSATYFEMLDGLEFELSNNLNYFQSGPLSNMPYNKTSFTMSCGLEMEFKTTYLFDVLGSYGVQLVDRTSSNNKVKLLPSDVLFGRSNTPRISLPITALEEEFFSDFLGKNLSATHEALQNIGYISTSTAYAGSQKRLRTLKDDDWMSVFVGDFLRIERKLQEKALAFINSWLQEFEIGKEILLERVEQSVGYQIFIILLNNEKRNLSDVGYGIQMVLRTILSTLQDKISAGLFDENDWRGWGNTPVIRIIEEPEAHLHPALQSKLADLFVDAAKTFGIQFIIETHSEYLIRKLQYLTAKGEIKPEDTTIYYFYPPDDVPLGEDQVKRIDIQEDGSLSDDFGRGFFDEADNLAIDLYTLVTQNRKN